MPEELDTIFGFSALKISQSRNIPKVSFYEHDDFTHSRKKLFTEDIEKLRLVAICDKNTINIEPLVNDERVYKEIFFLHVELKDKAQHGKISEIIHQVIPNPVVIIFTFGNEMSVSVAPKRLSKQEKGKIVVEGEYNSIWVNVKDANEEQKKFLQNLHLKGFHFENLHLFYSDIVKAVVFSSFIELTEIYTISKNSDLETVVELAKKVKQTQGKLAFHSSEDKKLKNFGDKVANHQKLLDAQAEWNTLKQTILAL